MKKSFPFFIVDVFTGEPFAGNQLAVVLDASGLPEDAMQKIARETNFSETTFVNTNEKDGAYGVRIFTPGGEVPFAGHPTLGTAYVIRQELIGRKVSRVVLDMRAGRVPVTFGYKGTQAGLLWMRQPAPVFGKKIPAPEAAGAVGLSARDLGRGYPVMEVSTGLPFIMVPVAGLRALTRARLDMKKYTALVQKTEAKAVYLFCTEARGAGADFSARMFAPCYGIAEDPATGSAAGCLAAYIYRLKGRVPGVDLLVEQGYEVGRPSLLHIRAAGEAGVIRVEVGGRVALTVKGEIYV